MNQYFTCKDKCSMLLSFDKVCPLYDGQDHVSEREIRDKTVERLPGEVKTVTRLQWDVREEGETVIIGKEMQTVTSQQRESNTVTRQQRDTVIRQQREMREERDTVTRQQREERDEKDTVTRQQREERDIFTRLQREMNEEKDKVTRLQKKLKEERETVTRLQAQAINLWELPLEDIHISQTILGTGAWGYVAQGTYRGQVVAVKRLHRDILSPKNEGRVRREISIMTQVRHPNLLLLIGAVLNTEGAGPLIVTELLDTSLRSAYGDGVLEERSKVPVLHDVSSALTYLHSHRTPIIHRDVSSANVLLEAVRKECQWKAKLSDFGSANLSYLAITPQEGAAVYSAPEVSTEDRTRQTAKIDVYSFGVLMCEVCLRRLPPDRHEFPSMLSDVQLTSPDLFQLSSDCTRLNPQDRPAMTEVLERLTNFQLL